MALDEQELRHLTEDLGAEWESLATYLGFKRSNIERFRIDGEDRGIAQAMFDMLVTWQQGQPQVINFRKALGEALEKSGRRDLAERICHLEVDDGTIVIFIIIVMFWYMKAFELEGLISLVGVVKLKLCNYFLLLWVLPLK